MLRRLCSVAISLQLAVTLELAQEVRAVKLKAAHLQYFEEWENAIIAKMYGQKLHYLYRKDER